MDGAVQLLAAIKKSKNEWVPMAVDVVIRCINVFVEYMNSVIDTELYSRSIIEWTKTSEYIFKQKDEHRRVAHDMAVEACKTLNEICDRFGFAHICNFDISDRQSVADFVGKTVYHIYCHGIAKPRNFDEILEEALENETTYDPINTDLLNGEESAE